MRLSEAKEKFICSWGQLGINWGINKTMGQIHALLLISDKPMCSDQVMDILNISRGSSNTNLHALLDWGLIYKSPKNDGCRKEYFHAEKNMSIIFKQIVKQRKKKELEPLMHLIQVCSEIQPKCEESKAFCHTIENINSFSKKADSALENLIKLDEHWLSGPLMRMIK